MCVCVWGGGVLLPSVVILVLLLFVFVLYFVYKNVTFLLSFVSCQRHWHRNEYVRMAERSKALRSGRSLVLQAWVRIPLLT